MKKLILIFILFIGIQSISQINGIVTGTDFTCQKLADNEYVFTFKTFFNLGSGSSCPQMLDYNITIEDDVLLVKGYYDLSGAWPANFCVRFTTINYTNSLPENVNSIKLSTNVISGNNTPPYIPETILYDDVYFQVFSVASLTNSDFEVNNKKVIVFPNPSSGLISITNDVDFEYFKIVNGLGQNINVIEKNEIGSYEINQLQKGLYNLLFYDKDGALIYKTKLIKN